MSSWCIERVSPATSATRAHGLSRAHAAPCHESTWPVPRTCSTFPRCGQVLLGSGRAAWESINAAAIAEMFSGEQLEVKPPLPDCCLSAA
eukprot:604007-Prymnesium_polylepis.3